jgi:O-acetyl-ADP-ribose deacetylase (regulator of RNase III)
MLTYVEGNLFLSPAQTLVNTVNTVGVMGKGIAKTFKAIYPEMYAAYAARCERGELAPGRLHLHRTPHKWILNFPTKRHWRQPSRLADIEAGLDAFVRGYEAQGITSVAFPQVGCGNGGLDWEGEVRPLMERRLADLPIDVYVHVYSDAPDAAERRGAAWVASWLQAEPEALAYADFRRDLASVLDESATPFGPDADDSDEDGIDQRLFDAWQQLALTGVLARGDAPEVNGHSPDRVFAAMARLPYLESAQAAIIADASRRTNFRTSDLLADPASSALLFVPPPRGAEAWSANQTPPQSQLSLTI